MAIDKCNLRKIIVTSMSFAIVAFGFLFFLLGVVSFGFGGSYSIIDTFRMFGDIGVFIEEITAVFESLSNGYVGSAFAFLAEFAFQIVSIVYFIIILIRVIKAIIVYARVWSTKEWDAAGESLGKSARGMILFMLAYLAVAFFLVGGFKPVSLSGAGATFLSWVCIYYLGKNVLENVFAEEFKGVKYTIVTAVYEAVKLTVLILSVAFLFQYPVYERFIAAFFNLIPVMLGDMDYLLDGVLPNLTGVIVLLAFGAVKKGIKNNLDGKEEAAKHNGLMAMIFSLVALTYDVIFAYAIPGAVVWAYQSAFIKIAIIGCFHFGMYFLSLAVDAILGKKEAAPVEEAPVEAELAPAEEAPVEETAENN
ncbi:MAG: hypothetical protein IJF44_00530 [Clostridia bacterium]|nr:hypothetical protein [Clostridia bacterium]